MPLRTTLKEAHRDLKAVTDQLSTLRALVMAELERDDLGTYRRERLDALLSGSEIAYLTRLFAVFEAGLFSIGPHLANPVVFTGSDALKTKLDRIGSAMNMPQAFRDTVDEDLRELRNELLHGRSNVPRLPIETVYELMRQFFRGCY